MILDLTYHERSTTLFEEDDSGDALYVLIEGGAMYKRSADDLLIGTFFAKSERPWFGEMALMGTARNAHALPCAKRCKLLTLHLKDFSRFFEIVPSFNRCLCHLRRATESS